MTGWRLGVVRAAVGFCSTISEERKSRVGSDASLQAGAGELTSKQSGQPPEAEFFTPDERRAAVQAAVALSAERFQGQLMTFDLPVAEQRGGFAFRVLSHAIAERSDEFHPSFVQHPKPDGQTSCLTGLTRNVHGIALLQGSQLLIIPRDHF